MFDMVSSEQLVNDQKVVESHPIVAHQAPEHILVRVVLDLVAE